MEKPALELDGYGYSYGSGDGDGYGYGDGYGDGYGSGYGYGYSYGSGDGDGYGYGYGYGYSYGSGDGDGDGYGDGYGYGYGYGYGEESKSYWQAVLAQYRQPNTTICFWRSNKDGTPANGGEGTKAVVGLVEEIKGPLKLCTRNALHGTLNPKRWRGERWWVVALHEPVQEDEDKFGSLKRTFIADLGKCPL
jgi:hypothetical protein